MDADAGDDTYTTPLPLGTLDSARLCRSAHLKGSQACEDSAKKVKGKDRWMREFQLERFFKGCKDRQREKEEMIG